MNTKAPAGNETPPPPIAPGIVTTDPDPTYNVMQLVLAAVRRLDDLREADNRRIDETLKLRADFYERLDVAESRRIDAIRAVDVNAVAVASERQAAAANVLATQVAQSADALRTLVSTTAAAMAEQQRQLMTAVTDRLTVVERSQYEGRGKELVGDPMMADLVKEIKIMRETQNVSQGRGAGFSASWAILIAAAGFLLTLLTIGSILFAVFK